MKKLKIFWSFVSCLILSGCALDPSKIPNIPDSNVLITQDIVNVLVQLAELPATTTTLNFPSLSSAKDPFAVILAEKFRQAGYAVRTAADSPPGETIVSYELARNMDPKLGAVSRYTVSIGDISVRRAYVDIENERVKPLAPMQIKGASAAGLRLDNKLFESHGPVNMRQDDVLVAVAPVDSLQPSARVDSVAETLPSSDKIDQRSVTEDIPQEPLSSLKQSEDNALLNVVAPTTYSIAGQGSELSALRELSGSPTRNVRELGQSNFAEALTSLAIVKEMILTFDNDSIRMGSVNKTHVGNLVTLFDEATDVFSVIGCSNGATNLAIGQEGLALGRAERVREELLFAGVPSENILEEGCWAGEYYDERMPRRGVVLSLKRHQS